MFFTHTAKGIGPSSQGGRSVFCFAMLACSVCEKVVLENYFANAVM